MLCMSTTRTRLTGPMSRRLRQSRLAAGLTQQQLADEVGASLKTINNYENDAYPRARKRYIVREWADATGRTFDELWGPPGREISRRAWNGDTRIRGRTPHRPVAA
jgi:transcriptional regulator with XRE-family HTH domain